MKVSTIATAYLVAALPLAVIMDGSASAAPAPIIAPVSLKNLRQDVCIAHRGNTDDGHAIEETLPAYRAAILTGATYVEGDIRWTKTGYPVMLHDADMGVFGDSSKKIANLSVPQAQAIDVDGQAIATLFDIREMAQRFPSVHWELELKVEPTDWNVLDSRIGDLKDRVTLSSFDLPRLRRAQDRGYSTVYLTNSDTSTTAAPVVAQEYSSIDAAHVSALKAVGVETYAFTPDTQAGWDAAFAAGVSKIITNKPVACSNRITSLKEAK